MREKITGSSNIAELGFRLTHEDEGLGTMEVRFTTGSLYSYAHVTQEAYEGIRGAQSVGSRFSAWLKSPEGKATVCTPLDGASCESCGWVGKMRALRRGAEDVTHCPECDSLTILEDLPR